MLDECAKGDEKAGIKRYVWTELTHNYRVYYNGRTFPSLPKYQNIEVGQVKKMAHILGIAECAGRALGIAIKPRDGASSEQRTTNDGMS